MSDTEKKLTHLDDAGHARMVDVSAKDRTARVASAEALVHCSAETLGLIRDGRVPKGDVLAVARVAGIAAAKRTPDLVPLCHPICLTGVEVDLELVADGVHVTATARAQDRTGVEMEALTSAAAAALTVYDMVKAVERGVSISDLRLLTKSGGRSGSWERGDA